MSSLRLKLRLAVKICDHWSRIPCDPPICPQTWQKTEAAWRLVEEARRRADTASRKCFAGAQESCLAAFRRICSELVRGASALCAGSPVPIRPGLPQLLSELRQIEDDFDDFEIDWHERRVSAYTPIIVLGEVDLGRFRIDLYWERFGSGSPGDCFEAIAEEPNCAAGHSEVCHPHVRGNRACLGDGAHALKSAMTEGRLADSFQVVASVLHTYNPGSAYVDLESWNGEECGDCGCTVSHDDSRWCSTARSIAAATVFVAVAFAATPTAMNASQSAPTATNRSAQDAPSPPNQRRRNAVLVAPRVAETLPQKWKRPRHASTPPADVRTASLDQVAVPLPRRTDGSRVVRPVVGPRPIPSGGPAARQAAGFVRGGRIRRPGRRGPLRPVRRCRAAPFEIRPHLATHASRFISFPQSGRRGDVRPCIRRLRLGGNGDTEPLESHLRPSCGFGAVPEAQVMLPVAVDWHAWPADVNHGGLQHQFAAWRDEHLHLVEQAAEHARCDSGAVRQRAERLTIPDFPMEV